MKRLLLLFLFALIHMTSHAQVQDDGNPYPIRVLTDAKSDRMFVFTVGVDYAPMFGDLEGTYKGISIGALQNKPTNSLLAPTGNLLFNVGKYDFDIPLFDCISTGLEYSLRCQMGNTFIQPYLGLGFEATARIYRNDNTEIKFKFGVSPEVGAQIYLTKSFFFFVQCDFRYFKHKILIEDSDPIKLREKGPVARIGVKLFTI